MPAVHCEHVPTPLAALNEPPSHSSHLLCPPDDWYVPGLHALALVEPVEHAEPAGQDEHCVSCASPPALLYRPPGHGSSADEPAGQ